MYEVLTRVEVAHALRCKPDTVDALARRGDLPSFFIGDGRLRRFHRVDVDAYIAARRGAGRVAV